ncbi:hypothetical protein HY450_03870, partial [Candidatus Pacearchaeota archaeon]|nr:hypothetical protein [Candidatus Pacearchaeota archaeon]
VIFDTKLIKIKTDPKRGERIFESAIKLLQSDEPPEANEDCEFCKWRGG